MTSEYTTIDLLRHGECQGGNIYRGHIDVPLTDNGWQQMTRSLSTCEPDWPWQSIVSSPLQRCQLFAQRLAQDNQLPIHIYDAFKEMHFGDWDGKSIEQIWQSQTDRAKQFMLNPESVAPPNGENLKAFCQRVLEGWHQALQQFRGQHILSVQHGGSIRVILAHVLNMPLNAITRLEVPYATLSRIRVYHEEQDNHPLLVFHNLTGSSEWR